MKSNQTETKTKWVVDQSLTDINFKVRHQMIGQVRGTFKTFAATIYTYHNDYRTAEVELWIEASSIRTGDEKRDKHLKSSDFLDVRNHKKITFTSNTVGSANKNGIHELWGKLTIAGISRKIKLYVKFDRKSNDLDENERFDLSVSAIINRSDWGLTWNTTTESGSNMVSNKIEISCEIELIKIGQKCLERQLETSD